MLGKQVLQERSSSQVCRSELGLVHSVRPALLRALSAKVFLYPQSQKAANRKKKQNCPSPPLCTGAAENTQSVTLHCGPFNKEKKSAVRHKNQHQSTTVPINVQFGLQWL